MLPLKQWICDTCHEIIETPEDGWLEWINDRSERLLRRHSFNIVHQLKASPRQPDGHCYQHMDAVGQADLPLNRFIGSDGLVRFIAFLDRGPLHDVDGEFVIQPTQIREMVEVMRRLYIPYYEEARIYWDKAASNGDFDGANEYALYLEERLKLLIKEYRPQA